MGLTFHLNYVLALHFKLLPGVLI